MSLNYNKKRILQELTLLISLLFVLHFLISLITWFHFEIWIPKFKWEDGNINWRRMVAAIPSILLFFASIMVSLMIYKKKSKATLFLLLLFLVSIACFCVETQNHLYQLEAPACHIGSEYSFLVIGWRYHYWNWWWYTETKSFEELEKESKMSNK
ncbi:MAG: hypothetical protein PHQ35_00705 [Phycisphaerae bacterium]|nr:hypothetical protein [Phycisphaerae bacterium]MDD5381415.1 hypothetical protein [Phycisphaerae bacterium]